jgi:prefoldin alpha subunit
VSASSAPPTSADQQVQEDLVRLDAYRNQLNAMLQQYQMLSTSRADHARARESLEGMERTDEASALLIPLGGETYLKGRPEKDTNVLVGIGAGIVIELPRPKVTELLSQRLTRIDEAAQELEGQIGTLESRIQALNQRLDALTREAGGAARADDVGGD